MDSHSKTLVVTRADAAIQEMTSLTHPHIMAYAQRIGADFHQLSHDTPFSGDGRRHYRIFALRILLEEYDRILSIDSDILVAPNCPNVFEIVPETHIGTVFEDVGSRQDHRRMLIKQVQQRWGNVKWSEGYINTGFFVVSKCHSDIFSTNNGIVWNDFGYDDVHLGYMLHKFGHPVFQLPFQWNHMTMFSEEWNEHADRLQSYVIHYAGKGVFDKDCASRIEQIRRDSAQLIK